MNDDKNKEQLTDHEYDGIREYDNPLPNWWLMTFWATVMFGAIYWLHYTSGSGPTLKEELAVAMAEIERQHANAPKSEYTEEQLTDKMKTVDLKAAGSLFQGKCAACHGENLQGIIGPNLTDEYWLHGKGSRKDIVGVIKAGVLEKGMPSWESLLKEDEVLSLAAYIISKQDSHPANGKAPQGEKVR